MTGRPAPQGVPPHALELRVHGVHGTSPNSMLGVEAQQVAGDRLTGIYRADGALPYRKLNKGHAVEAYSWGALTSGVQGFLGWVRRVLWLTLLPFAFVNVAYWSRFYLDTDRDNGPGREAAIGARCVRWAGLLLTGLLVLTPCLLFIDLIAWQCYGGNVSGCPRLPAALDFLARLNVAQRMALGSLLPVAVLALLSGLSRTTRARYEAVEDTRTIRDHGTEDPLRGPNMWNGEGLCRRLQYLHISVGLATIILFSGLQMFFADPEQTIRLAPGIVLAVAIIAVSTVSVAYLDDPPAAGSKVERSGIWWLPRLAIALTALHLALMWFLPLPEGRQAVEFGVPFRFNNFWFLFVIVGLLANNTVLFMSRFGKSMVRFSTAFVIVVPIAVLAWSPSGVSDGWLKIGLGAGVVLWAAMLIRHLRYRDPLHNRHESTAWRGAAPAVLLGVGSWVALLFTSAAVIGAADYLNGSEHPVSQLDTSLGGVGSTVPGTVVTVSGDAVLKGGVVLLPNNPRARPQLVGGTLSASVASTTEAPEQSLFDDTRLPPNSQVTLSGGSIAVVDTCVRTIGGPKTNWKTCRPSTDSFSAKGIISAKLNLMVAERAVILEITDPPQRPLIVPQVLIWTPLVQLLWILVVGVCLAYALWRYWRFAGRDISRHKFADDLLPEFPRSSLGEVQRRRATAGLAHRAEAFTDLASAVTTLMGIVLLIGAASGRPPWQLLPWTRQFGTISLYAAVGSSLLLVLLGSYVRRSESTRKAVGILWDLTTFWPRAAHPLAPPCYAERVVPELTTRIRWALKRHALVILSGHSQGSLIAVAVASRLEDAELERLRLVTYGSQIRALYGRVFPGVFGPRFVGYEPTLGAPTLKHPFPDAPNRDQSAPGVEASANYPYVALNLRSRIGPKHWINLFRRSDALGYRVFSDVDSDFDRPVWEVPATAAGDPGPRIGGHSGYQHTPEYRAVVGGWLKEVVVELPHQVTSVEPLPME